MTYTNIHHIDHILETVYRPEKHQDVVSTIDPIILRSWNRCVKSFHLEPSANRGARILTEQELKEFMLPVEKFLHIAKSGLQALYKQVHELNYVVLLTDKNGITVDYIGNEKYEAELKSFGLYLGADWGEKHSGTCAVGICATEMLPVTAHQTDHFDVKNTSLTCTAAPVFDPEGNSLGVLDVSALNSPKNKESQYLLLQLAKMHAHMIETANFIQHFQDDHWIVRFGALQEYVNITSPNILAIDDDGIIHGMNSSSRKLLTNAVSNSDASWNSFLGKSITDVFNSNLDFMCGCNAEISTSLPSTLKQSGDVVYYSAIPPIKKIRSSNKSTIENKSQRQPCVSAKLTLEEIAGEDRKMQKNIRLARRLLDSKINFLIQGETGSGKEVLARALHNESIRKNKPFIAVNCAAIPESLIESELFGYKPGTFTGARSKGMVGLIQQSSGGTLFLDEIGDMPIHLQTRLLRVLSEQEVLPLGSDKTVSVDLHVIAATHKRIESMIQEGEFREDLYFRIAGASIYLSSLRERDDKEYIIQNSLYIESGNPTISISSEALDVLTNYDWPGNVRELRNVLRVAIAFSDGDVIELDDLPDTLINNFNDLGMSEGNGNNVYSNEYLKEISQKYPKAESLIAALISNKWNITDTSKQLGQSRATIYRKMKKYNIVMPNHL